MNVEWRLWQPMNSGIREETIFTSGGGGPGLNIVQQLALQLGDWTLDKSSRLQYQEDPVNDDTWMG